MIFLKNNPHKPRTAEQALKPSLRGPDNYPKSPRSPCQGQDTAFQPQALLLADLPGARDRAGGQRDSSASSQCGWTPPWHPALRSPQPRARPAVRGRAGRRGGGGGGEEGGEGGRSRLTSPFPLPGFLCGISMLEVPTELRSEDLLGCAGPSSFLCASRSPVQAVPHRPGRHVPAASPPSRAPPRPWRQEEAAPLGTQSRDSGQAPAATSCHLLLPGPAEAPRPHPNPHPCPYPRIHPAPRFGGAGPPFGGCCASPRAAGAKC